MATHLFSKSNNRALRWYILFTFFSLLLLNQCVIPTNDDEFDTTLHFPKKFSFDAVMDRYTQVNYFGNGKYTSLERAKAGSFAAFIDTMPSFTRIENMKLPFTAIEFLDTNSVRLTSDGSLGIPNIDTIVGYTKEDRTNTSIITINWDTNILPPIQCTLSDWIDQSISFTVSIYSYTYRPFVPPFVQYHTNSLSFVYCLSPQLVFLTEHMRTGGYGHDSDFTNADTLAVHWVEVNFR